MLEIVKELLLEVEKFVPKSAIELEDFRLSFLGKKGKTNELFAAFKEVPSDQKKDFGVKFPTSFSKSLTLSNILINCIYLLIQLQRNNNYAK